MMHHIESGMNLDASNPRFQDEYGFRLLYNDKNGWMQEPSIQVLDTVGIEVSGAYTDPEPNIWSIYQFAIPADRPSGTWTAKASVSTGPYQGIIEGQATFGVYDADPNANDGIGDAEVIAGLPYSVEGYDITGSTTAMDDPTVPGLWVGQGIASCVVPILPNSVWTHHQWIPSAATFDTLLGLGIQSPGDLELVGCSDDIVLGITSSQITVSRAVGEHLLHRSHGICPRDGHEQPERETDQHPAAGRIAEPAHHARRLLLRTCHRVEPERQRHDHCRSGAELSGRLVPG